MTDDDFSFGFGFVKMMGQDFRPSKVKNENVHDTIMIHIHGGGFIAQSSGTHQCHTRE